MNKHKSAFKSIHEIREEGLTEEVWNRVEAYNRRRWVAQERRRLRKRGIIRNRPLLPTPLVRDPEGSIQTINGSRWSVGVYSQGKGPFRAQLG